MSFRISDWNRACVVAFFLLGAAAFVMFVIRPGGFETAIGWFFFLLPGSIPAYALSDRIYKVAPATEPVAYWILVISLTFAWYWSVSYVVIKIARAQARKGE